MSDSNNAAPRRDDSAQAGTAPDGLRIYIAASSAEMDRVHRAAAAAQAAGLQVVSTWPVVVANAPGGANPRDASQADRARWSGTDLAEVESADALWFLVPQAQTRGAWIETGYALARQKLVVCSGDTKQSVFCALTEEFDTDDQALAYLATARPRVVAGFVFRPDETPVTVEIEESEEGKA